MAAKCTAEANGATVECSCDGCGICYNHDTKEYTTLCCGQISTVKVASQVVKNPPKPGHLIVDFVGITLLQAAQMVERSAPGHVRLDGSLQGLEKRVSLKANLPLPEILAKLGLPSAKK